MVYVFAKLNRSRSIFLLETSGFDTTLLKRARLPGLVLIRLSKYPIDLLYYNFKLLPCPLLCLQCVHEC